MDLKETMTLIKALGRCRYADPRIFDSIIQALFVSKKVRRDEAIECFLLSRLAILNMPKQFKDLMTFILKENSNKSQFGGFAEIKGLQNL